ncbi:uracil-DNA glycosylase [Burkholderia vietnamiensis]|uniref:uracil-DNA glycosylase n=1 Tax=Burkholderia vietnamiensis TaxID=60552 RepID=UPI001CF22D75|nr:uracil-DNA glycosylase [Burkholderia vietnamiensis]MCA8148165.1 uracil-DNA glycosylase [Burkholderia vietnamiensis]
MADQIDAPRTLRDPQAIAQRRAMLAEPHIAPLALYVQGLRAQHPTWEFQDFDPLDGGVQADMLFLLEKPGPMTSPNGKKQGSGFISRNNDDPTAEAVFRFMEEAGIPRKRAVLWNVIPWWDKSIKFTSAEVRRGIDELRNLLPLLPAVRTVVLVGGQARRALPMLQALRPDLRICTSAHPGRQVYRFNPEQWKAIPAQWRAAGLVQDAARADP